jgi:hypothetical protein
MIVGYILSFITYFIADKIAQVKVERDRQKRLVEKFKVLFVDMI